MTRKTILWLFVFIFALGSCSKPDPAKNAAEVFWRNFLEMKWDEAELTASPGAIIKLRALKGLTRLAPTSLNSPRDPVFELEELERKENLVVFQTVWIGESKSEIRVELINGQWLVDFKLPEPTRQTH